MKTKKVKFFTFTLLIIMIASSYSFAQWGSSFPDIFNNNSGKLGFSPTGNFTTPDYLVDVKAGDINLHTFTNAYRIGDGSTGNSFPVLWHNGVLT